MTPSAADTWLDDEQAALPAPAMPCSVIRVRAARLADAPQDDLLAEEIETMSDDSKELSNNCKELSDAKVKIVELERKIDQFRNISFVRKHMMGNFEEE